MQLGFIGLGRMGANMVRRLIRDGHEVVVFNRTPEKTREIAGEGAKPSFSIEDLVSALPALDAKAVRKALIAALNRRDIPAAMRARTFGEARSLFQQALTFKPDSPYLQDRLGAAQRAVVKYGG